MRKTKPSILEADEIGDQIKEWWVEEVIKNMPFEHWKVSLHGNKIVIEPVKIKTVN